MCGLFGFVDTRRRLTQHQVNRLTAALAVASQERGDDATGIAFNTEEKLTVFKRPLPAGKMRFRVPVGVGAVMGHTRFTTQGNEKKNRNNHPFTGTSGNTHFAMAHNGMLHNDAALRKAYTLPRTNIQTDSYVAVQLLERFEAIMHTGMAAVAEQLEGSFTFTVLEDTDKLHFIKGNSPLCLWYFSSIGLYAYASTERILKRAIRQAGFLRLPRQEIPLLGGEILTIGNGGELTTSTFDMSRLDHGLYPPYRCYGWHEWCDEWPEEESQSGEVLDDLFTVAGSLGYSEEDICYLLDNGFGEEEIEELLYTQSGQLCFSE